MSVPASVFHVYDKLHLDRIPRRYTVEPGKQLEGRLMPPPTAASTICG